MNHRKRAAALVLGLVLAIGVAAVGVYAAASGAIDITTGGDAQQGATTVSGDCQTGPVSVAFRTGGGYVDPDGFMLDGADISGIDAACTEGQLVVITADGSSPEMALAISGGTATVSFSSIAPFAVPVGGVLSVAITLNS